MHPQPYNVHPNLSDVDLRGAWLNKTIAYKALGLDAGPGKYDLTPVNPLDLEALEVGCDFGGTNGYLRRAEANWRSGDSQGTVLAWVKLDTAAGQHAFFASMDEGGDTRTFIFYSRDTYLRVQQRNNDTVDDVRGGTVLVAGQWYRAALVSDGLTYAIYLNGQAETLTVLGGANAGDWLAETANRDNITIGGAQRLAGAVSLADGQIKDVQYLSRPLSADEIAADFKLGVPDDDLVLWTEGGMTDLTRFARVLTRHGGVVAGYQMAFDGTGDWIDAGDIGNVQQVSVIINPETTTEEILQIDTGKHITVSGGTVTYTGLTPVTTYVNGATTTALAADQRQHLVCQFQQDAGGNFELGREGVNYGELVLRDVKARDSVWSVGDVKDEWERVRRTI